MIHSFLLIGQSNMAGRGFAEDAPEFQSTDIKVLRNGRWFNAYRPINPDRRTSGVCLAESFARDYADAHKGVTVGLIPCADGGTKLRQWAPGGLLYDHAVMTARLAARTSNIAGVLWHQGESDCTEGACRKYRERLRILFESLRKDLDIADIPFIVGGLGDFLAEYEADGLHPFRNYRIVNEQLKIFAEETPLCGFADAQGLTSNPDLMHFNSRSLYEFGHRYYNVFETLEDKNRIFPEKPEADAAIRSEIELL